MLRRLTIRDFVLVDRLELEFMAGFGTLTGETGAGKSILVDALTFVLGERADAGLIRAGRERAEVSAEFALDDASAVDAWLRDKDLDGGDGLLLRRVLDASGRSRAYLNGSPATVHQLREVSELLVDIHGQHAHQSLLRAEAQRLLLDAHARLCGLTGQVADAWRQSREAQDRLESALAGAETLAKEREQLAWQVRELETLGFSAEEWQNLDVEHQRLSHAASLVDGARFSLDALAEDEVSCEARLDAARTRLDDLSGFDPALAEIAMLLQSAQAELGEAISALRRYADRLELDPARLGEVERRIEAVLACARKYRASPGALPGLLADWRERLSALGEAADTEALAARAREARQRYEALGQKLSAARAKAAKQLGTEVSRVMQQLALSGGRFEIALVPVGEGGAFGLEQVEFRIAGLAGAESRPLAKVASGGELSRISLAIQVVTSQAASVPTLVFDEVDVGIGGGVAEVVGRLLRELGSERQVLCVTHLPQVAARANWQWQVSKSSREGEVSSRVVALDESGRVEEIARMLGGVEITAITRRHAREMLGSEDGGQGTEDR
ncbi:MAG: DNA repair protein RecN [Candidatus Accumulibacter sp.]|jgi:DNA repair protein RecN (Recombination protein N)|nr:DNA repair protein RecN [Accumulibacter sp.]